MTGQLCETVPLRMEDSASQLRMVVPRTVKSGGDSLKTGRRGGGQHLGRCGARGKDLGNQKKCRSPGRQSEAMCALDCRLQEEDRCVCLLVSCVLPSI